MRKYALALIAALVAISPQAGAQPKDKGAKDAPPAAAPAGKGAPAAAPSEKAGPEAKAAAPAGKTIPDNFKLNLLIRSTVIAVNQANKTGNYSVLRDLSAPGFKTANPVEKLAELFKGLRETKFDLSPIMFFDPKLVRPPAFMDNGMLRLSGFFDTQPQRVNFDLLYEDVQGEWLLYGVSIGTMRTPAKNAEGAAPGSPAAPAAAPAADAAKEAPKDAKGAVPAKK